MAVAARQRAQESFISIIIIFGEIRFVFSYLSPRPTYVLGSGVLACAYACIPDLASLGERGPTVDQHALQTIAVCERVSTSGHVSDLELHFGTEFDGWGRVHTSHPITLPSVHPLQRGQLFFIGVESQLGVQGTQGHDDGLGILQREQERIRCIAPTITRPPTLARGLPSHDQLHAWWDVVL